MSNKEKNIAMYESWKDELIKLRKIYPNKAARWYAAQISEMDIAKGRSLETIVKKITGGERRNYVG